MCPDKNLLSAYFDGELGKPWSLDIEAHVSECNSCRRALDGFQAVRSSLASSTLHEELEHEAQAISGWNLLQRRLAFAFSVPAWRRRFQVPIPVFAGMTLLVIALSVVLLMSFFSQKEYDPFNSVTRAPLEGGEFASVEEILNFLDARGEGRSSTFQLPQDTKLRFWSEPTLIRAADYHRGMD